MDVPCQIFALKFLPHPSPSLDPKGWIHTALMGPMHVSQWTHSSWLCQFLLLLCIVSQNVCQSF